MNDYLKEYAVTLRTKGPVHIGTGQVLSKKEYILQRKQGKVWIPDLGKLYMGLGKCRLQRDYEAYLLKEGNSSPDLGRWLQEKGVQQSTYRSWMAYELDCGDFLQDKGAIQVMPCQKDNYGLPYIPGSSLKGMLRTILLAYEIVQNARSFEEEKKRVPLEAKKPSGRTKYLSVPSKTIEEQAFYCLNRKDKNGKEIPRKNAVNDCLSGMIVSDSQPVSLQNLILCQKRDEDVQGRQHAINMLRESVRPGCDICFSITIDSQLCKYDIDDIRNAIKVFSELYYTMYLSHFQKVDRPSEKSVWLGGGTGYFTKTVLYPLLGEKQAVSTAVDIFEQTLSKKCVSEHKHYRDKQLGVSPHILKCTQYQGKKYQMGMCEILIK